MDSATPVELDVLQHSFNITQISAVLRRKFLFFLGIQRICQRRNQIPDGGLPLRVHFCVILIMAFCAFSLIRTEDVFGLTQMAIHTFHLSLRHDVLGYLLPIPFPSCIESLLKLMAATAIGIRVFVMAGCAALFGRDKFSMCPDVGVAARAIDPLFQQVAFVGKTQTEYLFVDFLDSCVTIRTKCGNFAGDDLKGLGLVSGFDDTEGFAHLVVRRHQKLLGKSHIVNALSLFDDLDVEVCLFEQCFTFGFLLMFCPCDDLIDLPLDRFDLT